MTDYPVISDIVKLRPSLNWILLTVPIFQVIKNIFNISYRQTFTHWCFILVFGLLVLTSGIIDLIKYEQKIFNLWPGGLLISVGIFLLTIGFCTYLGYEYKYSAILNLVISVLVIISIYNLKRPVLSDELFTITVLKFTPISDGAVDESKNIQHRIEKRLNDVSKNIPIRIIHKNENVPYSLNEMKRQEKAIKISDYKSHIVLWGDFRKDDGEIFIEPRISIVQDLSIGKLIPKNLSTYISNEPNNLELKKFVTNKVSDIVTLIYGLAYYNSRNWNKAIEILQHSNSNEARYYNAICIYEKAKDEKNPIPSIKNSISILELIIKERIKENKQNNALVYYTLGYLYGEFLNKYEIARNYYQKSICEDSLNANAYTNLGILCIQHFNDMNCAKENFIKAIELEPDNAKNYYHLAMLYHHNFKDYDNAKINYQKAIELKPDYAAVHNDLAWLFEKSYSDYLNAKIHYEKAIESDPYLDVAKNNLYFLIKDHFNYGTNNDNVVPVPISKIDMNKLINMLKVEITLSKGFTPKEFEDFRIHLILHSLDVYYDIESGVASNSQGDLLPTSTIKCYPIKDKIEKPWIEMQIIPIKVFDTVSYNIWTVNRIKPMDLHLKDFDLFKFSLFLREKYIKYVKIIRLIANNTIVYERINSQRIWQKANLKSLKYQKYSDYMCLIEEGKFGIKKHTCIIHLNQ